MTARRRLSWLSIGRVVTREVWVRLRPDHHSGSQNNWVESASFVITSANGSIFQPTHYNSQRVRHGVPGVVVWPFPLPSCMRELDGWDQLWTGSGGQRRLYKLIFHLPPTYEKKNCKPPWTVWGYVWYINTLPLPLPLPFIKAGSLDNTTRKYTPTYTYFKKRCRRERRMAVVERKLHDRKELWFP